MVPKYHLPLLDLGVWVPIPPPKPTITPRWPTTFLLQIGRPNRTKQGLQWPLFLGDRTPYPALYLIEQVPGLIILFAAAPAEDRFVAHLHQLPFRAEAEVAKNSKCLGDK